MPPLVPVDPSAVVLTALFNPAVVMVALWLGAKADQWQKLPVAAFAAALIGSIFVYGAVFVGVPGVVGVGRAAAGVFIAEFVFGLAWAALGYQFWRWRPMRPALSLLRWWLIGTGLVLGAVLVWAFAPVLVFLALLTGALGVLAMAMIGLARSLERALRKGRADDGAQR